MNRIVLIGICLLIITACKQKTKTTEQKAGEKSSGGGGCD